VSLINALHHKLETWPDCDAQIGVARPRSTLGESDGLEGGVDSCRERFCALHSVPAPKLTSCEAIGLNVLPGGTYRNQREKSPLRVLSSRRGWPTWWEVLITVKPIPRKGCPQEKDTQASCSGAKQWPYEISNSTSGIRNKALVAQVPRAENGGDKGKSPQPGPGDSGE
jgi:hypothetical protein